MPFTQFGLPSSLLRNVLKLGYEKPTPIQSQAIPAVQRGRDLVGTAQTGTGKTAAFLLPVMQQLLERPRGTTGALVLTPTRELAGQIEVVFRSLAAGTPLRSALVIGGAPPFAQERALRGRRFGRRHARPDARSSDAWSGEHVRFANAGPRRSGPDVRHGLPPRFEEDHRPPARQTANAPLLGDHAARNRSSRPCRSCATRKRSRSERKARPPTPSRRRFIRSPPIASRPCCCTCSNNGKCRPFWCSRGTKHGAKRLAGTISDAGHGVAELHSNRSPTQRARAMQVFRSKTVPVMVATNIAARGIDVRHITHVVNFDVPNAPEEYVHRIGRTGRAGDTGDSLVLVAPEEHGLLARIERQLGQRIPRQHCDNFDYQANKAPAAMGKPKPKQKAKVFEGAKKKPYRGQGGRR